MVSTELPQGAQGTLCLSAGCLRSTQGTEHLSKTGLSCTLEKERQELFWHLEAQKKAVSRQRTGQLVSGNSTLALKIRYFASRFCSGASDTYCKPSVLVKINKQTNKPEGDGTSFYGVPKAKNQRCCQMLVMIQTIPPRSGSKISLEVGSAAHFFPVFTHPAE